MIDVVIPYKHSIGNELKYTLRSLCNLPHGNVYIVGDREPWFADTIIHIPTTTEYSPRFLDSEMKIGQVIYHQSLSDEFYLFNDDMFIMKPVEYIPMINLGTLDKRFAERIEAFGSSTYNMHLRQTAARLKQYGIEKPLDYESHIPMLMNKYKRRIVHDIVASQMKHGKVILPRSVYGNLFEESYIEQKDVKVYDMSSTLDSPYLSTTNQSFEHGHVGRHIRDVFKVKSVYEI